MRPARLTPLIFLLLIAAQPATEPSDQADTTVDQLLSSAAAAPTTSPTTRDDAIPATRPSVLLPTNPIPDESRTGTITFSDGKKITGKLSTTLRQPIRVWDDTAKQYQDLPFSLIRSMEAQVIWERQEKEWKFAQSGSDIKEYSGRTYPARLTSYTMTLTDGTKITGSAAAPIYVQNGDDRSTYILHKTDKGDPGQTIQQLVYIKSVQFAD